MRSVPRPIWTLFIILFASEFRAQSSQDAVDVAVQQIDKPYYLGGTGPDSFDCSGLMQYSYAQAGVTLPRQAIEQSMVGTAVVGGYLTSFERGDLLFFWTDNNYPGIITHVGIFEGGTSMIIASSKLEKVVRAHLDRTYWKDRFVSARRVLQIANVEVRPTSASIAPGQTLQLSATAKDSRGNIVAVPPSNFLWNSDDLSVATVSASGLVTAVANGNAQIGATEMTSGKKATMMLSVRENLATITVTVNGNGMITSDPPGLSCPGKCAATFTKGTLVSVIASSADRSTFFESWGGCDSPISPCSFVVNGDKSISATFLQYKLDITSMMCTKVPGANAPSVRIDVTAKGTGGIGTWFVNDDTNQVSTTCGSWSGPTGPFFELQCVRSEGQPVESEFHVVENWPFASTPDPGLSYTFNSEVRLSKSPGDYLGRVATASASCTVQF